MLLFLFLHRPLVWPFSEEFNPSSHSTIYLRRKVVCFVL
jgi:hypothetical protein